MRNKNKIYVVGSSNGSYRARVLLEYLAASNNYVYYHNDQSYLTSKTNSFIERAYYKITRSIDRVYNLHKLFVADVIYILPMASLKSFEIWIAKLLKKKVIGEFYISLYDTYVNDRKTVKKNSIKAKRLLRIDQNFIDICSRIIFLNSSERAYYLQLADREIALLKTDIIPLATNSKQQASLPFAHGKRGRFVLCWWGTFIPLHGLDKIIESAQYLKESGLDFRLYLFGTSEEKSAPYKKQIAELGLDGFVIIDNKKSFADKSLDRFLVDNCDVAFGNFGDSKKAKTVMVNKVIESASMRLPVLSQRTLALEEYFTEHESVYFCDSSAHAIAEKIINIIDNKENMIKVADGAYKLYRKRFSKNAYLNDIVKILNNTCKEM